jgi:hypothetical protein
MLRKVKSLRRPVLREERSKVRNRIRLISNNTATGPGDMALPRKWPKDSPYSACVYFQALTEAITVRYICSANVAVSPMKASTLSPGSSISSGGSVWDCRLIRRPANDARRRHEPFSAGLQTKALGHQKMALESTLPPHNDGVARRLSERIESCFHAQSELL